MNHYQRIKIERTAQYLTLGRLTKQTKYIWFALHGYGQTAEYMAGKLSFLNTEDHFVICPEGLNKFYWHTNNDPVACWMTKRHRYEEIDDFVGFLDGLYDRYCRHVNQQTKVIFFGFSQGCATVWRWLHASQPRFTSLINWAGWIPEDIGYLHLKEYLNQKELFLHYGSKDKYLTPEVIKGIEEVIEKNQLSVMISQFEGKHNIPSLELTRLIHEVIYGASQ